jgi:hypothetical protein
VVHARGANADGLLACSVLALVLQPPGEQGFAACMRLAAARRC